MRTRLEIDGIDVPIISDVPISTTYSLADIREPDKRNTAYTKTIRLAGTSEINKIFENIFEVNVTTSTFNPNKKVPACYYVNDVRQLRGDIHLLKVVIDNGIFYDLAMTGDEGSLFQDIGDKYLTDIDMSELDHPFTKAVQKNSWATSYVLNGITTPFNLGDGYVYPFINYGYTGSNTVFDVDYFKPAIYARTWIRKIFEQAGYTWQPGGFFDSATFKRLIIPCNIDKIAIPPQDVIDASVYAGFNTNGYNGTILGLVDGTGQQPPFALNFIHKPDIDSGGFLTDVLGQYNTSTGILTIANSGVYNYEANVNLSVSVTLPGFGGAYTYTREDESYTANIEASYDGGANWNVVASNSVYTSGIVGTSNNTVNVQTGNMTFPGGALLRIACRWYIDAIQFSNTVPPLQVVNNNYTQFVYGGGTPGIDYRDSSQSYVAFSRTSPAVSDGQTLLMNNAIPRNIKQKDFVTSIIKMFNLNIEADRFNPKVLRIETKDDFYSGSTIDWTYKVDYSKPIEIVPMGDLNALNYVWKYKEDNDFYNSDYDAKYVDNYGLKRFSVDNDFVSNEYKTELVFSPTPLVGNVADRIICPVICAKDGTNIKPIDHNIRILYYGGLKPLTAYWMYTSGISGTSNETHYPYAGHFNDPYYPTFDLSFGYEREVYYTFLGASLTGNNLFRLYHEKYINEITDRDSKIFRAYMTLNETDINTLSFRPDYFIENAYYRLNKVMDYDQKAEGSYLCEFIKIKKYELPPIPPLDFPFPSLPVAPDQNRLISPNNEGLGTGVRVQGSGNFATGQNIVIDSYSQNVQLINCQRVVAIGLKNFVGVGLSDMVLDNSYEDKVMFGKEIIEDKPRFANILMLR